MLDSKVVDLVGRMVHVQFDDLRQQLPREIAIVQSEAAMHGMATSGPAVEQVYDLCAHDIATRTLVVWQTLRRVLLETGMVPSETLAEDLKDVITSYESEITGFPSEQYDRVVRGTGMDLKRSFNDALDRAMSKVEAEIDLFVLSLSRSIEAEQGNPQGSPRPVFHIQSVGAIQTGPSATANIVMNIGSEDREALLRALDIVKDGLATVGSLPAYPTADIIELVDEVKFEIAKPTPNGTRLSSLASAIATAIQTVGSLQPAYQALKAALLPFGIMLP